ncbi:unnamed protein product [Diamesa serratosioi]
MDLWNDKELPMPILTTYVVSKEKFDMSIVKSSLDDLLEFFGNTKNLHIESAHLSRFVFMNCKQFRMMKGMQEMKKVQQGLKRYFDMNIVDIIQTFMSFLVEPDDNSVKLNIPYRQNFDYLLIKLQGLSKLLVRIIISSKNSANFFLGLVKAGSFYIKGTIIISTIGKVWDLCRNMCKTVVRHFNELIVCRNMFKIRSGLNCPFTEYKFPQKLDVWLEEDWNKFVNNPTCDHKMLMKEGEIQLFLKNVEFNEALLRLKNENTGDDHIEPKKKKRKVEKDEKINVETELEDYKPLPRFTNKVSSKSIANVEATVETIEEHSISNMKCKETVMIFIKHENNLRKDDVEKSLTISKMKPKEWKSFRLDMEKKSILMQDKIFVDYVKDYLEEYKI